MGKNPIALGGSGSGSVTASTSGQVAVYSGATTVVGNSRFTDDATTLTYTGSGGITAQKFTSTGGTESSTEWANGSGACSAASASAFKICRDSTYGAQYSDNAGALRGLIKPVDPTVATIQDDFIGGSNTNATIGELQWFLTNIGGAPTVTGQNGVAGHPGILRFASTTTINQGGSFTLNNNASVEPLAPFDATAGWEGCYVFRVPTSVASIALYVGFGDVYNTVTMTNFVGFRLDTGAGDSAFTYVTYKTGTATTHATTKAASANVWHQACFKSTTAGTIQMLWDGDAAICFNSGGTGGCTANANIPTVALAPLFALTTLVGAASKDLDVDYFGFRQNALARY